MPSVEDLVSSPLTELATVICSPSRIHAPPRPHTSRVWNGDQFNRSRRAGIRLRIGRFAAPVVVLIAAPSGQVIADTGQAACPGRMGARVSAIAGTVAGEDEAIALGHAF